MAFIRFEPDVLDAAYKRETDQATAMGLVELSRTWHNRVMRLIELQSQHPTENSRRRIDALMQVYMFYLIRHAYTNENPQTKHPQA